MQLLRHVVGALSRRARTTTLAVAAPPHASAPVRHVSCSSSMRAATTTTTTSRLARMGATPARACVGGVSPQPSDCGPVRGLKDRVRGVKSCIKKRFKVKPNGSILRLRANRRHLMIHKSSARTNSLGKTCRLFSSSCVRFACR